MASAGQDLQRITVTVPRSLYQRLLNNFEWGERGRIISLVLNWICDKVEAHGKNALVLLLREGDLDELVRMGVVKDGNNQ